MTRYTKWLLPLLLLLVCFCFCSAGAEVASLSVYLTGIKTAGDGSPVTVPLTGSFRVLQNGEEIGTIDAGTDSILLTDPARIRLVPVPQTFSTEWDLTAAYVDVKVEAGSSVIVPVTLQLLRNAAPGDHQHETESDASSAEPDWMKNTQATSEGTQTSLAVQEPSYAAVTVGPTPTLPPFDAAALSSPEPNLSSLYVSGTCWFDSSADGLYDMSEATIPGVKIEMDGIKNGQHYETVSGENGLWCIDNVDPAAYNLTVTAPEGMMFTRTSNHNGRRSIITKDGVGKASKRIDLNDKVSKKGQYIGFTWTAEISGICFLDANYNGMYDEGEEPLKNVKITAIKQARDEEVAVAHSGEDGRYTLTGLRGNTYKMRAVLPDNGCDFTITVNHPLGNHFKARPGRRENFWTDFSLVEAQKREMNVGAIFPGTITGTVYMDNDFSGSYSGSEKIVSGFQVTLKDLRGTVIATDKTSVKGKYELTEVPPGDYTLSVYALSGYAFTKVGEGNVIRNLTAGEGYSEPFHVDLRQDLTGMDIGMIQPGTVTGTVFADRNDNGVQDGGEGGLPGVVVRLMSEEGEEAFSGLIGESGQYLFDAVMPGRYYLEFELPADAVFARMTDGGNAIAGNGTIGQSEVFNFATAAHVTGPVCGALTLGHIQGMAYHDSDGNGIFAAPEEKQAGVQLSLIPSRSELEPIHITTDEEGRFSFEQLRPDAYTLSVACPASMVLSRTDQISLPLNPGRNSQEIQLTVAMGDSWEDQHLGVVTPAALKGQIWFDENNNGLFDDWESRPEGYEVTVTDDLTGKTFDTLRTDAEGVFATGGLIPGSFSVSFLLNDSIVASVPGDSVFVEKDGRLTVEAITLSENEERGGLLMGIIRYTSLDGSVWIDRGDAVEPLADAEIRLTDGQGNIFQTSLTDGNGHYRFMQLVPGEYVLEATMPEGCVIIEPYDRRLEGGSRISVITHAVNREGSSDPFAVSMGQDVSQMDIGCVLPGRLGDLCWLDLDGDGLQGMDEPGIPGVHIELLRDGTVVAETASDQYGFYRFEDIYPAVYVMRVTPPAEVRPTSPRTDIPIIASVLQEEGEEVFLSAEIPVMSDKATYNADMGFVCRREGVYPPGIGEAKTQNWTKVFSTDE